MSYRQLNTESDFPLIELAEGDFVPTESAGQAAAETTFRRLKSFSVLSSWLGVPSASSVDGQCHVSPFQPPARLPLTNVLKEGYF